MGKNTSNYVNLKNAKEGLRKATSEEQRQACEGRIIKFKKILVANGCYSPNSTIAANLAFVADNLNSVKRYLEIGRDRCSKSDAKFRCEFRAKLKNAGAPTNHGSLKKLYVKVQRQKKESERNSPVAISYKCKALPEKDDAYIDEDEAFANFLNSDGESVDAENGEYFAAMKAAGDAEFLISS